MSRNWAHTVPGVHEIINGFPEESGPAFTSSLDTLIAAFRSSSWHPASEADNGNLENILDELSYVGSPDRLAEEDYSITDDFNEIIDRLYTLADDEDVYLD